MITPGWLPVHRNFGAGGIEIHVIQLVEGLIKRGHEITIITTRHPEGIKKEEFEGLNIYYVGDRPLQCTRTFYNDSIYLFNNLNLNEQFDVVHSQDYAGYGFAKQCNDKPHVVTSHGTPINSLKSILNVRNFKSFPKITLVFKWHFSTAPVIFKKCDRIVTVSNELKEDIQSQYKIPENKITTIPNGVDANKFKPFDSSVLKKKLGIKNSKLILFVGGITKQKGIHILVDSFIKISEKDQNIKLLILGSGPYLKIIKEKVKISRLENNVIFINKLQNEDEDCY
jgi:glycosyltransferase involved in cell wall biosynthesis